MLGVDGNLIRAIRSLYVGHNARLRLNGELSDAFGIELGVKEGCVLSPELFKVFINDLITAVNSAAAGVDLSFAMISCLLFADDLVMMSESLEGLKKQATALESWCTQNELMANVSKTKVMIMNTKDRFSDLTINGEVVEVVHEYRYLGLTFCDDLQWKSHFISLLKQLKSRLASLYSLFSNKCMSIAARLSLYKSLMGSLFRYGSGVWQFSGYQLQELERVQLRALRTILGCATTTTSAALYSETGLSPVRYLIDKSFLQFAGKIGATSCDRIVHKLFVSPDDGNKCPWRTRLALLLRRYNLCESFQGLKSGHVGKDEWKTCVQTSVWNERTSDLRSSLSAAVKCSHLEFSCDRTGPAAYFSIQPAKLASFFFKLRSGSLRLEIEEGRFHKLPREERLCRACGIAVEDVKHFLLDCHGLAHERKSLPELHVLTNRCTSALAGANDQVILDSLGEPKKGEDHLIFHLYEMWKKRCSIIFSTSSPSETVVTSQDQAHLSCDTPRSVHAHRVVRRSSS